jgi:acyl transferase domain-containing protein/acyl carrier protein/ribosomal protein S18 acetylase RimI-like enzyme
MLEVVNTYLHGYVAMPMLGVCRDLGIFSAMEKGPVGVRQMTADLSANAGYCGLVFRALHALGCVESTDREVYTLSERFRRDWHVPASIEDIYRIDFGAYLWNGAETERLDRWLIASARGWDTSDAELGNLMDGAIMVPLLLELAQKGIGQEPGRSSGELAPHIHPHVQPQLQAYLAAKDMLEEGASFTLNARGLYLCERALTMASTASYRPMLLGLRELLCGDPANVLGRDADGHETHVDRTLNVIGSGFQHNKYFQDLADLVVAIFDREPLEEQPRYIIDMGCGDGALLKTLYAAIAERSLRGRHLEEHPLLLIGADFNEKSLQAAARTLEGFPHLLLKGDIAKPQALLDDLKAHGVTDADAMLHVRSFLDHDRPLHVKPDAADAQPRDDLIYVNAAGDRIGSVAITRDLREHLARWSGILGRHGLILLEVFSLPVELTREYFSQTENFHFDFYHAMSRQALVGAGTFLQALASAGLYPDRESLVRYPRTMPFSRIVLQHVRPKPFAVRPMRLDDVPDLLNIDRACWPENLRLTVGEIERRHAMFPEGQFVVEYEQRAVGVLYTQRIDDLDRILASQYADYPDAHVDRGRYWQLLGLSMHPDYQSLALGDQLLEHVLDLAALTAGVEAVYGITRCLSFRAQPESMADYVQRKDAQGLPIDPLPRFHCSHGATIEQIVPGARPEDVDNDGAGVLIRYDLAARLRGPRAGRGEAPAGERHEGTLETVARAVRRVMKTPEDFTIDRPLKELGLDSMGLMELRLLLNQAFRIEFEPAYFFNYTTAKAIAGFIAGLGKPADAGAQAAAPGQAGAGAAAADPARQAAADIAIVGMALRFPGGIDTPEALWQLLADQGCVITERPGERWSEYRAELDALDPQYRHIHRGGFLEKIDQFDAAFFHITPLEAQALDPQQRLLLELAWEAMEHAGIDPHALAGNPVGIFLGANSHDYETLTIRQRALGDVDAHFAVGNALATAAGRLAYFFDFHGPTVTVDTACSSASSAIFAACQSLADGGAELAVAGSVNMMITPTLSVAYAKAGMLSPDGLCKTFDSTANGYVRSEGGAVLLLKRLDDALRDGDHIHALIKSAALMQDGRTNGLTAPNGQAQVEVIRRVLALADRTAADVDFVEAHGTGTYLGDPVEMQALRQAYCDDVQRAAPLYVGSVKTNLGHTEAVSGMAGILKVVLALRHESIPAHLHLKQLNEFLKVQDGAIEVPRQARPWKAAPGRPRLAGVSSFGFSGSNTHMLIEEFVMPQGTPGVPDGMLPAVVSAKSRQSLRDNIMALARYVDSQNEGLDLAALSRTLTRGRAQHAFRLAFPFGTREELRARLGEAMREDAVPRAGSKPRIAFMFTGQGAQYHGMARRLAQSSPSFRRHLEHCAALVREHGGGDLFDVMWGADRASINQTRYTQVALFCVGYSLAEMLREAGIEADAVMGHSVGEFAAACYAGVMDLDAGIRLLCHRGALMHEQTREGSMVALLTSLAEVEDLLRGYDLVAIAAMNGTRSQVIAGGPDQVAEIVRHAEQRGIAAIALPVERAFHSPLMAPILPQFRRLADELDYAAPGLDLISNVTGEIWSQPLTGQYWTDHIGLPVRFEQSVRSLLARGVDMVVEIGPRPVLTGMAKAAAQESTVRWLPTLLDANNHGLADLYTRASQFGLDIDWRCYPHPAASSLPDLPRYRFDRSSHWVAPPARPAPTLPQADAEETQAGVLARFQQRIDPVGDAALWAHVIVRQSVFPAGGYVALAIEAGLRLFKRSRGVVLRGLRLERILWLERGQAYRMEVEALSSPSAALTLQLRARPESGAKWTSYAQAVIEALDGVPAEDSGVLAAAIAGGNVVMDGDEFYARLAALGYGYLPPFQGVRTVRRTGDTVVADLRFQDDAPAAGYAATPWGLDGCFQTVLAVLLEQLEADGERMILPVAVARMAWHAPLTNALRVTCRCRATDSGFDAHLRIVDASGTLCIEIDNLACAWVRRRNLDSGAADAGTPPIYTPAWREHAGPVALAAAGAGSWLILSDERGQGAALAEAIAGNGGHVVQVMLAGLPAGAAAEAALADLLQRHADNSEGPIGLIHAWPIDIGTDGAEAARRRALDLVVMKFLAALPAGRLSRAIVLTRLAQQVRPSDVLAKENAASLWGLVGSLRAEAPGHAVTLVDLAEVPSGAAGQWQAAHILQTPAHAFDADASGWPEQFALRGARCHVRQLVPATTAAPVRIAGDGCYIVSGGLGGIGRLVAEFLHAQGAGRVLLLGRRAPAAAPAWVQTLNRRRACIATLACDVTDRAQVAGMLGTAAGGLPIRGIVHAAGIIDDALLAAQDTRRLHEVYAPKVEGAHHLLESVAAEALDFAWLFSSVAGLFGGAGQSNYAAANAALDGYAHWLRSRGVRAMSINWGPWRGTGMAAGLARPEAMLARMFSDALKPEDSPALFGALLAVDEAQCCVTPWRQDLIASATRLPYLLQTLRDPRATAPSAPPPTPRLADFLEGALGDERKLRTRAFVAGQIARITGLAATAVDPWVPLSTLGMDSMMSLDLQTALSASLGKSLAATLLFDHPTLDALAAHVLAQAGPDAGGAAADLARAEAPGMRQAAMDLELDEIENLGDDDLGALLGKEFINE